MATKKNKNPNFLDTPAFIRELADRAGFSIADTKVFMDNFTGLIADSIEQGIDIDLRGLFHLYIQNIKSFTGINAYLTRQTGEKVVETFPKSKRVIIKLSTNMTDLLRDPDKKKIKSGKVIEKESEGILTKSANSEKYIVNTSGEEIALGEIVVLNNE